MCMSISVRRKRKKICEIITWKTLQFAFDGKLIKIYVELHVFLLSACKDLHRDLYRA